MYEGAGVWLVVVEDVVVVVVVVVVEADVAGLVEVVVVGNALAMQYRSPESAGGLVTHVGDPYNMAQ